MGYEIISKLNGMYAFAFMTKKKYGLLEISLVKSLYYYHKGKKFIFVSEAKSLQKILNISKRNDKFYNAFQHVSDKTLWKNVYQLPAAHFMEFNINENAKKIIEY